LDQGWISHIRGYGYGVAPVRMDQRDCFRRCVTINICHYYFGFLARKRSRDSPSNTGAATSYYRYLV
jgi:hypothetical protein